MNTIEPKGKIFGLLALIFFSALCGSAQIKLAAQKVTLKNGKSFSLKLPEDFEIIPAAEGLKRVRFFARAPDGRIFVTDMYNLTDNRKGAIYILDEFDEKTGKFGRVTPYLTNLKNPNSVQFYTDAEGQDWLYLAETDKLTRRKFQKGETAPTDRRVQIVALPAAGRADFAKMAARHGDWLAELFAELAPADRAALMAELKKLKASVRTALAGGDRAE